MIRPVILHKLFSKHTEHAVLMPTLTTVDQYTCVVKYDIYVLT
jgi:hypothetical protein